MSLLQRMPAILKCICLDFFLGSRTVDLAENLDTSNKDYLSQLLSQLNVVLWPRSGPGKVSRNVCEFCVCSVLRDKGHSPFLPAEMQLPRLKLQQRWGPLVDTACSGWNSRKIGIAQVLVILQTFTTSPGLLTYRLLPPYRGIIFYLEKHNCYFEQSSWLP